MKYFRVETANGSRYVKSKKAIRTRRTRRQAAQILQEPVAWVRPISPIAYATKKLIDKMFIQ